MKIAINGFGRIGRQILKIALDRKLNVVAINDTHGAEAAAYTLKYDTVYGKYDRKVEAKGNTLVIDGKKIAVLAERDPTKLPWREMGVDVIIESTGAFTNAKDAAGHITAGAKKLNKLQNKQKLRAKKLKRNMIVLRNAKV
jgi:glyceraldehyde 3-phosphate dehydrogenase